MYGSLLLFIAISGEITMTDAKLRMPPALWIGRSLEILCCLSLVLIPAGCSETSTVDPLTAASNPPSYLPPPGGTPSDPPVASVVRLHFPLMVGTVLEYSYWYEEGMYTWGAMAGRTESRGCRLWEVTSTTGDTLTGTITICVTGTDTVITKKNSTDMINPGPIDTAVVTADIKTFTVTFSPDSMKADFWTVTRTGQSSQGSFARILQPPVDSVRVGGDGFYFPYAVYQDNLGLKRSYYRHSSGMFIQSERLTFVSKRLSGVTSVP